MSEVLRAAGGALAEFTVDVVTGVDDPASQGALAQAPGSLHGMRSRNAPELRRFRQLVDGVVGWHLEHVHQWPEPLEGDAYAVTAVTWRLARKPTVRRPRHTITPDVDKLLRALLDALTAVGRAGAKPTGKPVPGACRVWRDDAEVVQLDGLLKRYAEPDELPGVQFTVIRFRPDEVASRRRPVDTPPALDTRPDPWRSAP